MERRLDRNIPEFIENHINPLLGQQKPRENWRKGSPWLELLFRTLKFSLLLMGLTMLGVGTHLLWQTLSHSSQFDVATREIQGLQHISENQILLKVREAEEECRNIFRLNLSRLRQSIEQLPWIKEAAVRRTPPDKLLIEIRERVPIGYVRLAGSVMLVDEEGIFLEANPDDASPLDFPVLLGLENGTDNEGVARNQKRLAAYRTFIGALDENGAGLSKDISEVHLSDPDDISVVLNEETVLVRLGNSGLQEKFRRYLAMSRELKQKYPALDTVDLRYQSQVVVSMAGSTQVVE
jgi:cell division protein FtsQ